MNLDPEALLSLRDHIKCSQRIILTAVFLRQRQKEAEECMKWKKIHIRIVYRVPAVFFSSSMLAVLSWFWHIHEEGVTGVAQEPIDLLCFGSTHTPSLLYGFYRAAGRKQVKKRWRTEEEESIHNLIQHKVHHLFISWAIDVKLWLMLRAWT